MNYGGIKIRFQMRKNRNALASKLRPVITFKCEKCYFTGQKEIAQPPSVTGGAI